MPNSNHRRFVVLASISGLLLAGCATTVPKPQFARQAATGPRISAGDAVKVDVDASQSVKILPYEEHRFAQEIEQKIRECQSANPPPAQPGSYEIDVHLTRYEKGNKFARFMLAGLGQIHIDGNVEVVSLPDRKLLESFALKKTFAWGGAYGVATSIQDIENTFAEGIAQSVTGQQGSKDSAGKT